MILNKTEDHRDALGRMRRRQLVELAHANGHADITETMAADDYTDDNGRTIPGIRTLLRQRGVRGVRTPNPPLGARGRHETRAILPPKPPTAAPPKQPSATSDEWAEFQAWKASQQAPAPAPLKPPRLVPRPPQEINLLRDECKRLGIPMGRRDGKAQLKAKLEAHKAQHGQNAPTSH